MTHHIALYGKGGVGKTTLAATISASMVEAGLSVMLVGCDSKADSTSLLNNGFPVASRNRCHLNVCAPGVWNGRIGYMLLKTAW